MHQKKSIIKSINMRFFYMSRWFSSFFPTLLWQKKTEEKIIYLTFDDGPIPEITEWILDILIEYQAKATFLCVGDNIRKHPFI